MFDMYQVPRFDLYQVRYLVPRFDMYQVPRFDMYQVRLICIRC